MSNAMFGAAQLEGEFDVDRLVAELVHLEATQWAKQRTFGESLEPTEETESDWRVLPLRSPEGRVDRTDPGGMGLVDYAPTPWMEQAPYIASIVDALPTDVRAVRLMALGPGAEVSEHRDYPYGLPAGWVRLHIPLITNEEAVLTLDGVDYTWQPGTLWFGDFNRLHSVRNGGSERRVHLVIDSYVSRELLELFPADFRESMRWSDVLVDRPEMPLGKAELHSMLADFALPGQFLYGEIDELDDAATPDLEGRLRLDEDRLILDVGGVPTASLVHVGEGEFRMTGGMMDRTLKVEPADGGLRVRFRRRHGSRTEEALRSAVRPAG
ncbi:aspartyl/asparaginyl beta-hydroxylase domain-containing protein [Streptomyces formicae]|uniref:Aspartyl/asparaginyl beta-hydroxylase-related dioxygenase n=1 Tax=Streptomyces formicae TaxID=1616117 RepID=A0A291Q1V8_9ACTN|nr:aspartyl/asparaginyl beta-hydroxylase domain-containing protein [Streptomyces formicae]ATL25497.1 Aspartyl/asparaginyl beta-hydroxylase-related dioxygenase [Streptomyces formicae]